MLASLVVRLAGAPPPLFAPCVDRPAALAAAFVPGAARTADYRYEVYRSLALRGGFTRYRCACGYEYAVGNCGRVQQSVPCPGPVGPDGAPLGRPCGRRNGGTNYRPNEGQTRVDAAIIMAEPAVDALFPEQRGLVRVRFAAYPPPISKATPSRSAAQSLASIQAPKTLVLLPHLSHVSFDGFFCSQDRAEEAAGPQAIAAPTRTHRQLRPATFRFIHLFVRLGLVASATLQGAEQLGRLWVRHPARLGVSV